MKMIRMFLDQKRIHYLISVTIVSDVVIGYFLKHSGYDSPLALAILYLVNILVLIAVYRFWRLPVFECDNAGFTFYGLSPFTRERCSWEQLEYVCFKELEIKKGKPREFLVLHYIIKDGRHKTNMVPMYMIGFSDRLKSEFLGFLRRKGIKPECQPGL